MKYLILLLFAATLRAAPVPPPVPDSPPEFDQSFQGAAFTVLVKGTYPTTYQWYRGTATDPKKVKIPAPEGIQPTLIPKIAGWYSCESTNAKGSTLSDPMQYATTRSKTAPKLKVTERVP